MLGKHVVGRSWGCELPARATHVLITSVGCLMGINLSRWPAPPPKPDLCSGVWGVAVEGTIINGTACFACCSNNVQWMQFHSWFQELQSVWRHYQHIWPCGYILIPTLYSSPPPVPSTRASSCRSWSRLSHLPLMNFCVPFVSTDILSSNFSTSTLWIWIHTQTSAGNVEASISSLLWRLFSH